MIVAIIIRTCVVPVLARCANAHLLSFGGDLVLEFTAFILNLPRTYSCTSSMDTLYLSTVQLYTLMQQLCTCTHMCTQ
jgi:hypothetical protein